MSRLLRISLALLALVALGITFASCGGGSTTLTTSGNNGGGPGGGSGGSGGSGGGSPAAATYLYLDCPHTGVVDGDQRLFHAAGVIERVDVRARELTLRLDGVAQVFGLPPGCPLFLHGEAVKLRLLQPADRAHVFYTREDGALVAHTVRVG